MHRVKIGESVLEPHQVVEREAATEKGFKV